MFRNFHAAIPRAALTLNLGGASPRAATAGLVIGVDVRGVLLLYLAL